MFDFLFHHLIITRNKQRINFRSINFYLSERRELSQKKKKTISISTLYNYYLVSDASPFPESKYFERILSAGKFCWKRVPRECISPSLMQRRWRGERATITKQPVEIRETPERNWGLVGRHDREILVARGQSFWRAFFFLFFFFLPANYRHSKFSFMTDIHPRRSYPSPRLPCSL